MTNEEIENELKLLSEKLKLTNTSEELITRIKILERKIELSELTRELRVKKEEFLSGFFSKDNAAIITAIIGAIISVIVIIIQKQSEISLEKQKFENSIIQQILNRYSSDENKIKSDLIFYSKLGLIDIERISTEAIISGQRIQIFTTPIPTSALNQSDTSQRQIFISQLKGKINVSFPDTMEINRNYQVSLSMDNFSKGEFETIENKSIKVKAVLVDPSGKNFSISLLSPDEQIISDSLNTLWRWNIEPVSPGSNQHLILRLSVTDGNVSRDISVLNFAPEVEVPFNLRVKDFIITNWEWLISAILLPLLAIIFNYNRQRKNIKRKSTV